MDYRTSFFIHFIATEVSATGLKSLIVLVIAFLGTGIMTEDLKDRGNISCARC